MQWNDQVIWTKACGRVECARLYLLSLALWVRIQFYVGYIERPSFSIPTSAVPPVFSARLWLIVTLVSPLALCSTRHAVRTRAQRARTPLATAPLTFLYASQYVRDPRTSRVSSSPDLLPQSPPLRSQRSTTWPALRTAHPLASLQARRRSRVATRPPRRQALYVFQLGCSRLSTRVSRLFNRFLNSWSIQGPGQHKLTAPPAVFGGALGAGVGLKGLNGSWQVCRCLSPRSVF